jgi:hypothetical protein
LEKIGQIETRIRGPKDKQHSETDEMDRTSLQFVEMIDYQPTYDEKYLQSLRDRAKKSWLSQIDPDAWLGEMRGGYDA